MCFYFIFFTIFSFIKHWWCGILITIYVLTSYLSLKLSCWNHLCLRFFLCTRIIKNTNITDSPRIYILHGDRFGIVIMFRSVYTSVVNVILWTVVRFFFQLLNTVFTFLEYIFTYLQFGILLLKDLRLWALDKRKSRVKQPPKKQMDKLDTICGCPFCNNSTSVEYRM